MKPASKPQYASVEQPLGCDPPSPHCPICGHGVLRVDDEGLAHADPCTHLSFIFVGEVGEFEYRSPGFEKKTVRRRLHDLDLSKLRKLLERIGYGNELLALEVTYGGMACGPVWYTDVYGFDYGTVGDEEEDEDESVPAPAVAPVPAGPWRGSLRQRTSTGSNGSAPRDRRRGSRAWPGAGRARRSSRTSWRAAAEAGRVVRPVARDDPPRGPVRERGDHRRALLGPRRGQPPPRRLRPPWGFPRSPH